jgi:hypothetical protein
VIAAGIGEWGDQPKHPGAPVDQRAQLRSGPREHAPLGDEGSRSADSDEKGCVRALPDLCRCARDLVSNRMRVGGPVRGGEGGMLPAEATPVAAAHANGALVPFQASETSRALEGSSGSLDGVTT